MIRSLQSDDTGVTVEVEARSLRLGWAWLRDHARDESSFLADTQQRVVTPADVAAAGRPRSVRANADSTALEVSWDDGATTKFGADFLASLVDPLATTRAHPDPLPWTSSDLTRRYQPLTFDDVLANAGRQDAVEIFWRDGLVLIRDIPIDVAATRQVLERFGYIRTTIFGGLWEYGNDGGYDDTASTSLEITPHTDGTYSHDAPGLLALHCHRYEATGGENVFVDGVTLVDRLSDSSRETLSTVEIPAQYIGDGAHLMSRRPTLRLDDGRLVQVSYNHHDRAPFVLPEPDMTRLYAALHELDALAADPALQFELALRPGDMVLFDNWRLLHGRRAFDGHRRIAGGYLNREDIESTTRLLGI